jgi:hypothetical protein
VELGWRPEHCMVLESAPADQSSLVAA